MLRIIDLDSRLHHRTMPDKRRHFLYTCMPMQRQLLMDTTVCQSFRLHRNFAVQCHQHDHRPSPNESHHRVSNSFGRLHQFIWANLMTMGSADGKEIHLIKAERKGN